MAITILADLDGTLLPRPFSTGTGTGTGTGTAPCSGDRTSACVAVAHPPLSEGPAYGPLVRLLDLGATVVGITGSQLSTHRHRFFDSLPLRHRRAGRVLLAVETGSRLYRPCPSQGTPIQCRDFSAHLGKTVQMRLDDEVVQELVRIGRKGLAKFNSDLVNEPDLVDGNGPLAYLRAVATKVVLQMAAKEVAEEAIPITDDTQTVPRIEIRKGNSAVVFVGIPSPLGNRYFSIPAHLQSVVDGRPTGRSCYDCVPAGLDKSHVVQYLIDTELVKTGRAFAIGDQPAGNDEGLTRWHPLSAEVGAETEAKDSVNDAVAIPFISVSERPDMVPPALKEYHISRRTNAEGSAEILTHIADYIEAQGAQTTEARKHPGEEKKADEDHDSSRTATSVHFDAAAARKLVQRVNSGEMDETLQ